MTRLEKFIRFALENANNPSLGNPFATMADINNETPQSINVTGTTDSTSSTTGSVKTAGGMGVAKALYVGTSVNSGTTVTAGTGVITNSVTEKTAGSGITLNNNIIRKNTLTALNATGTITAPMLAKGGISSTSAAAVTATLDTATLIGTQIGAAQGTSIEFLVDNTAGANTVTVAVATGIVVATPVITGGDTLTVAASATQGIGIFRLVFSSATACVLYRIG